MYTNSNLEIIQNNAPYTDNNGIKYPRNFPKDEIAELHPVTTVVEPMGVIINGYHIELIDVTYTQVWDTSPLPAKTWGDVADLQQQLLSSNTDAAWRIMRYKTQEDLTDKTPKENSTKYQALLQYIQDVRDADETNHATPQLALDALNTLTIPAE